MDTENRKQLQDIYAAEPKGKDEFRSQVSSQVAAERNRVLMRQRLSSFAVGSVILLIFVGLIILVVKHYMSFETTQTAITQITTEYVPRYSLPSESQWVLDLSREFADPTWNGEGDRPFNAIWVKKAAYNLILAEQAYTTREYKQSAEFFENALEIFPDLDGVKIQLGMTYFHLKEYEKALALLKDLPEDDLTYDILNNLGASFIQAKAYEKAEHYLNKSIEKKPAYAEALKNLAILYKTQDRETEAIDTFEKYLDQRPLDNDTRYIYALYLVKKDKWEYASEQLDILTKDITDEAQLYFLLARVETELKHPELAIAAMQRGVQLVDPSQGMAFMSRKQFDDLRQSKDFKKLENSLK